MGIPVVGRRHQREALTPQATDWGSGRISKRICGVCGSGRSPINHQQWKQAQKPTANHNQYSLGALLSRGIATQGFVHARLLQYVRKELDCAPLGKYAVGPDQNSGSREVAAGNRGRKWNPGQNLKCVMSALFSHAVRWEFCGHNPISSGIPVGSGGKRGPSTGVRVSSKRRRSPLKLTAAQVALVLTELEFRDQRLVVLDAGLGTRRGELVAL